MDDSWEGPGSPSHASSPLGSHEELHTSRSEEEDDVEAEEMDEEVIMSEFRELYKGMTSTMLFDFSTESLDSTGEDTEKLKAKLNSLKIYVLELKESYDELLKAFGQLELSSKDSVADMEGLLASKVEAIKNLQNQVERLENLITELNNKLGQAEIQSASLSAEKTHLMQENAQLNLVNGELEKQVQSLQDASQECDLLQQDLSHVLDVVKDGVTEGTLKLSELSLQTQCVSLPRTNLPLGSCDHDQLVDHYQVELSQSKQELDSKANELEKLRGELDSLQEEHDGTLRELAKNRNVVEAKESERDLLDQQVSEARMKALTLEQEVAALTEQLEQALQNQGAMSETLSNTRQAMDMYQKTAQQDVEHRDQELAQLKLELSALEQQRNLLEQQVKESKKKVKNLEDAHSDAQKEVSALRKEIEEMPHKKTELEEVLSKSESFERDLQERGLELEKARDEKNQLEKQLSEHILELQSQIDSAKMERDGVDATAADYKNQLQTLSQLHSQCEGEAGKLRRLLESKEAQLSKMLTALQIAAAQISAFHPRVAEDGAARSPGAVDKELTQCELAIEAVEKELLGHRKQWEEALRSVEEHKTAVEALAAERNQLSRDVKQREQRVAELEALLQEVNTSRSGLHQDYEAILEQLKKELRETKELHQQACDEIIHLQDQLQQSQASATEQHQLLSSEVQKREESISELQSDGQTLKQRYESVCEQVEAGQKANQALQNEYDRVLEELASKEQDVVKLEDQLKDVLEGQEELARCSQVIAELKQQLELSQQQLNTERERAELNEEESEGLKSQHAHLSQLLKEREEMIQRLEEESSFLEKQHSDVQQEVDRRQKLIESLQESLASSQGLCDGLQHEVSECEHELQELQDKLRSSYQEKQELQDRLIQLTAEIQAAHGEVDSGSEQYALFKKSSEEKLQQLQTNIEDLQSDLSRVEGQKEILEKTSEEQRAELVRLRLAVSDLELLKESLLFQSSTKEGTINSLESQIATLEKTIHDNEEKCQGIEQDLEEAQDNYDLLESQLATANDKLLEVEQSRSILEVASSERLNEITRLQQKVDESEVREGLVSELREMVASLEDRLRNLQAESDNLSGKLLESDRSQEALEKMNTDQRVTIAQLERRVSECGVQEELVDELREQIDSLEEQLAKLQTQYEMSQDEILSLQSTALLSKEKEHYWSCELSKAAAEIQLYKERVSRLEDEVKERREATEELRSKLDVAQHRQEMNNEEITSSRRIEESLYNDLAEKRKLLLDLEHKLGCYRDELTAVKGQLAVSEESRQRLLQQIHDLEGDLDGLKSSHSETELELANARANLDDRKTFCNQLQEDCEHMTERVTSWAQEQKTSTEALAQKLRDQEAIIVTLKQRNSELETENEELHSQMHLTTTTTQQQTDPLNSSGSNISLQSYPSITKLRAQLDVDISNLVPGATVGYATATTSVPIKFDSHYRTAMEKGMSPPSLEDPVRFVDSETESEAAALDKDYWIRRAGELSLQLQQSGEYWSQKVRELSLELEKRNQQPQSS